MSAIVLDRDSKGRLSAFGCVSFVTFLWRNKEKFFQYASTLLLFFTASARPVSACWTLVCPSTYRCAARFLRTTNRRLPLNSRTLSSLHRYGHRSYSECRQLSWTWFPKGGLSVSAQSQCDNVCTKSLLYVTIRATAITTRKGVRSLLKKLFFGETKKSLFNTHLGF